MQRNFFDGRKSLFVRLESFVLGSGQQPCSQKRIKFPRSLAKKFFLFLEFCESWSHESKMLFSSSKLRFAGKVKCGKPHEQCKIECCAEHETPVCFFSDKLFILPCCLWSYKFSGISFCDRGTTQFADVLLSISEVTVPFAAKSALQCLFLFAISGNKAVQKRAVTLRNCTAQILTLLFRKDHLRSNLLRVFPILERLACSRIGQN